MKNTIFFTLAIALIAVASVSHAQVTIVALDVRGNGIFGMAPDDPAAATYGSHAANATAITVNGAAPGTTRSTLSPTDIQLTYNNLDLDGDTTANDSVTFTLHFEKVDFDNDGIDGGDPSAFNQGVDTGFGQLNDMELSVTNVSGTTTDGGATIFFDGFTGANIGAGGNAAGIDRTVELNGVTVNMVAASTGAFQFIQEFTDFAAPVATVTYDNSGDTDADGAGDGGAGSIVARSYDLQFSLTDPNTGTTLKGDVDLDGMVTFLDINPFIGVLSGSGYQAEADCDCDGMVTFLDINPFINILSGTP